MAAARRKPMPYPIVLQDAFKGFTFDQDKICPPEETVGRLKERLGRLNMDILAHTRRIDNGRIGIPVYFSVCGKTAAAVTGTKKQMGKGATDRQAEASAVMELAERFSFFSFCKTPDNFFTNTMANLGPRAMPFERIALSVHDVSTEAEALRPIVKSLPLRWTQAFNLTRQQPELVPFDWFFTINEFNGPSAGNCVEEALCQGICEVVERHVSSIVSRNRLSVPAIDPDTATDPAVVEMLAKYRRAGIKLYVSDFSLDTGIPTVGVLAYDPTTFPKSSEIVWTAGTTCDPQKALSRALTEVAQLAGDFNSNANYVASGLPKFTRLDQTDFIINCPSIRPIQALPDLSHPNIRVEVENLVGVLGARGLDVTAIDVTHAGLQVPAFYTIIPGAHFRERADGASLGLFTAKLVTETMPARAAADILAAIDQCLPDKYFVHFYRGLIHLNQSRYEQALGFFRSALTLGPPDQEKAAIYSYLGVCLKQMDRFADALVELEQGVAIDAERTDIHNLMGFCHFKLKSHQQAIACFEKAIALNPSSAIDYANIGANYRELGDSAKAAAFFHLALDLDPGIDFARQGLERLKTDG